jgi:threonine/homoserine/homoserine lactone efflux protein
MKYLVAYGTGAMTGFVLSLMLGTVFFAILNYSIKLGYKKGVSISIGVILSDLIFISICLFGSQYIPFLQQYENTVKIAGGILIIVMGLSQILSKNKEPKAANYSRAGSITYFVTQGFLLNFLNPVNLISWFAIYTYLLTVMKYSFGELSWYFAGSLSAIFMVEFVLSYFAEKLNRFLPPKRIRQINMVVGILFIGLGIFLMVR